MVVVVVVVQKQITRYRIRSIQMFASMTGTEAATIRRAVTDLQATF
jgi:hypothetical protein